MLDILSKLFDSNEKQLNKFRPLVEEINALESKVQKLSDENLAAKTSELRKKLKVDLEKARKPRNAFKKPPTKEELEAERKKDQDKLFEILPEAFAYVKEASNRKTGHKHYDVQLLGGIFMARNTVIELFTGEGKTIVAHLSLFLYGLMGKSTHLVTVNDYLARRDAEFAGHIFSALGMTVGAITPGAAYKFITDEEVEKLKGDDGKKALKERNELFKEKNKLPMSSLNGLNLIQCSKKEAYDCDVVYGTNNEFGFDYLRDNMAMSLEQRVQSPLYYAIVDECDSILIDEARTPLIISQPAQESNEMYKQFASLVRNLEPARDYIIDEKAKSVAMTDEGVDRAEKLLGVKNLWENYAFAHHLDNALKAKEHYKKDDAYIIKDGQVMIVDQFTGRVLPGRRYSEGLHQAIEAKEGVEIKKESRTLATITFQNFFRLYDFLAGMTGTALTEAEEFAKIYDLDVVVIPTNVPVVRKDYSDLVFRTQEGKFNAVVDEIKEMNKLGRPVLVGTTSVENSEVLSDMLKKEGIKHNVLNAKQHQKEAMIVKNAGQTGQVTIATNMAGRGTDIALGDEVPDLGGLHVIGTERHESRRIDNQLRGRSGRQGDPGSSRFYVSFEDDLMRLFGGNAMGGILGKVGMDDSAPVEASIIGRSIESAQKRVESHHFDIRKHLVEYDDVLNQQREIIYDLRRKILSILKDQKESAAESKDSSELPKKFSDKQIEKIIDQVNGVSLKNPDSWDVEEFKEYPILSGPLRMWILKLALERVEEIVNIQLQDDAEVDDLEERKVIAGFLDIVPLELVEKIVDDWDGFVKKFYTDMSPQDQKIALKKLMIQAYVEHLGKMGEEAIRELERVLVLRTIDNLWVDHLDVMTDLREGIGLRGYAQRDPLVEYKNEGFSRFEEMLAKVEGDISRRFFKVRLVKKSDAESMAEQGQAVHKENEPGVDESDVAGAAKTGGRLSKVLDRAARPKPPQDRRPGKVNKQKTVVKGETPGRNDPCPCGSGKKYKKCCHPKYG